MDPKTRDLTRREALLRIGAVASASALGGCAWTAPRPGCEEAPPAEGAAALLAGIDTFVVVMMENRSFDHYLGALRGDRAYPGAALVDGLRGDESNPDPDGAPVPVYRMRETSTPTPPHQWEPAHAQFAGGRNDGFVRAHAGPQQRQVMGYYDRETLPFYYALADEFTVCDRWFSSVMGPTWPNRFYLHAATSQGVRDNRPLGFGGPPTLWERLRERCLPGVNYAAGAPPWYVTAFAGRALGGDDAVEQRAIEAFFRDARRGELPALSIIEPDFQLNDDRPPNDVRLGQAFVASIYRALAEGPQWPRALLLITYDEHGGFFDHVAPPRTVDPDPAFAQLGFRVPTLVVGGAVRRGHVCSQPLEHVSVAATLAARFGLRGLGPRMDAAATLAACIDPALLQRPRAAPRGLPTVAVSEREIRAQLARHAAPEQAQRWLRAAADLEALRLLA